MEKETPRTAVFHQGRVPDQAPLSQRSSSPKGAGAILRVRRLFYGVAAEQNARTS